MGVSGGRSLLSTAKTVICLVPANRMSPSIPKNLIPPIPSMKVLFRANRKLDKTFD
jgi:hypothetical protein